MWMRKWYKKPAKLKLNSSKQLQKVSKYKRQNERENDRTEIETVSWKEKYDNTDQTDIQTEKIRNHSFSF